MILTVADALVTLLVAEGYTSAVREYTPRVDLKDLASIKDTTDLAALRLLVVPRGDRTAIDTRANDECTYTIDVAIQCKLRAKSTDVDVELEEVDRTEIDSLLTDIVDPVKRLLNRARIGDTEAYVFSIEHSTLYSQKHLDEMRVFTSVLTLTIQEERSAI